MLATVARNSYYKFSAFYLLFFLLLSIKVRNFLVCLYPKLASSVVVALVIMSESPCCSTVLLSMNRLAYTRRYFLTLTFKNYFLFPVIV